MFFKLDGKTLDFHLAKGALTALDLIDTILGVMDNSNVKVDENIQKLIKIRNKARNEKDWEKADEMRKQLDEMDIILDDTPEGTVWKKKVV